ncbi:hypothetical protein AVEN_39333-1 [Araneus ventricosus]|uniref:Uncharacterized protein n=1 Tax=Araneus ventricosus TaxID=182803 RepID=A0A4Y2NBC5_ARAVE|nr:hypothetical protein AVEN_39333-1 [Araneus ventricosus]
MPLRGSLKSVIHDHSTPKSIVNVETGQNWRGLERKVKSVIYDNSRSYFRFPRLTIQAFHLHISTAAAFMARQSKWRNGYHDSLDIQLQF